MEPRTAAQGPLSFQPSRRLDPPRIDREPPLVPFDIQRQIAGCVRLRWPAVVLPLDLKRLGSGSLAILKLEPPGQEARRREDVERHVGLLRRDRHPLPRAPEAEPGPM